MEKARTERLAQITVMNALLCLFVVMIHLTYAPLSDLIPKSLPHILLFSVNKLLGFCVPAFIFLSGFKLFKSYEKRPLEIRSFYMRRLKKIVLPYFFAVIIYIFYFGAKGWLSESMLSYLLLGTISAHFYYIVVLVQLYLLFPLIFRLFDRHSHTIFTVSYMTTLFCSLFLQNGYWDRFFGLYIFYFVFGMFWAKYDLYDKIKKKLSKLPIIFTVILVFHILFLYLSEYSDFQYWLFPVVNMIYIMLAIMLLYVVSEDFLKCSTRVMTASRLLGRCSYSVYLYHLLLIFILKYDILPHLRLSVKWEFFITSAIVYGLIFLYCKGLSYAKKEKK